MYSRYITRIFTKKSCFQRSFTSLVNPSKTQQLFGHKDFNYLQRDVVRRSILHFHNKASILPEEHIDPLKLVVDELSVMANTLRSMVANEIPRLATAAEYFFEMGVEGKSFRPMVLLLMRASLNISNTMVATEKINEGVSQVLHIPEIAEMIHVASILHSYEVDDANTQRGASFLNDLMGNKLSILAGDFLLARAFVALASFKNTEVVELLSIVVEHIVTAEIMRMTNTKEQRCSKEYYLERTFYKTGSLMANSCMGISLIARLPKDVSKLAYEYGHNLGLAYQILDDIQDLTGTTTSLGKGSLLDIKQGIATAPILFALEEHPGLQELIYRQFKKAGDVDLALEYLEKSDGIKKAKRLAAQYARNAAAAVECFPPSESDHANACRMALIDLTETVITTAK